MTTMAALNCAVICKIINIHTRTHVISIIDPPKGGSIRMAYNVKDDRAGLCNLINTHTHVISIIGTPLGGSLRVA